MTGGQIYNEKKKILISLQNRCGGLVIPIFNEIVKIEVYSENLKKNPEKTILKSQSWYKEAKWGKPQKRYGKSIRDEDKVKRLIDL